jgi:4-oxalocrotonate tautomerase
VSSWRRLDGFPWAHSGELGSGLLGRVQNPLSVPCQGFICGTWVSWKQRLFQEDDKMPLINVKVVEGTFSAQQKREMIEKLTETMVSIEGEALRNLNWVVIEEVSSGDWGIGGRPLTTENLRAMAAGAPR